MRTRQALGSRRWPRATLPTLVGALLLGVLLVWHVLAGSGSSPIGVTTATGSVPGPGSTAYAPTSGGTSGPVRPTGPLTVVALGDSVPAARTCHCAGYVEQVGALLQASTHRHVVVHNDAVGGWTTADVAQDLTASGTRADLSHADLVVVEVGANDFDLDRVDDPTCFPAATSPCWSDTIAALRAGLAQIISSVRALDASPDLRIAVAGYWNVTVDGAVGRQRGEDFVSGSDALTRLVNQAIADVAQHGGATYVDAYVALKGGGDRDPTSSLLADGDHPNAQGHTLLAQEVYSDLVRSGAVATWGSG